MGTLDHADGDIAGEASLEPTGTPGYPSSKNSPLSLLIPSALLPLQLHKALCIPFPLLPPIPQLR